MINAIWKIFRKKIAPYGSIILQRDFKFTFIIHTNKVMNRPNNKLSWIMWNTKDFKKPDTYISLYLSLVCTTLIHASPEWNPHHKLYAKEIKHVKHRFFRSNCGRLDKPMEFNDHNYKKVSKESEIKFKSVIYRATKEINLVNSIASRRQVDFDLLY